MVVVPLKMEQDGMASSVLSASTFPNDSDQTSHSLTASIVPVLAMENDDRHDNFEVIESARDLECRGNNRSDHAKDHSIAFQKTKSFRRSNPCRHNKYLFIVLIVLVGSAASAALMTTGVLSARHDQDNRFERLADEFTTSLGKKRSRLYPPLSAMLLQRTIVPSR
jgi:hypothetical protein